MTTKARSAVDSLEPKTRQQWERLSARTQAAIASPTPCDANSILNAVVQAEPQSPAAPAYLLWVAENFAREARYAEALEAFDSTIDCAQSTASFIPGVDFGRVALHHKAHAATHEGNSKLAIRTFRELEKGSRNRSGPLFEAGLVAEAAGIDDQAAGLYRSAAGKKPSAKTDDSAELARRAILRLEDSSAVYLANVHALSQAVRVRPYKSHF